MPRRSLKPQLNQIRTWVREGRTDAWIAHQLEITVRDLNAFKRDHELVPGETADDGEVERAAPAEERDLREEDDALIAAELDAAAAREAEEAAETDRGEEAQAPRRRGRRGGRRRRGGRARREALQGTFDHGEEGYGLWLDPAVQDDAVYAEHWAGHRPVTVTVEPDRIVIERSGEDGGSAADDEDPDADA